MAERLRRIGRISFIPACVAVVLASLAAAESRTGPTRIAYISLNRVAAQNPGALASAKKLQQLRDEKARLIQDKQKQVEAIRLELARSGGLLQASKRDKLRQDDIRETAELQKLQAEAQNEFQKAQHQYQSEFQGQLSTVLGALAKQRGADLVLNQDSSVMWSAGGLDWTADVVQRLNALQPPAATPPAK